MSSTANLSKLETMWALEYTPLEENQLCIEKVGYLKAKLLMPMRLKDLRDTYQACHPGFRKPIPEYCNNKILERCLQQNIHLLP